MRFHYQDLYFAITAGDLAKLRSYWTERPSCVSHFDVSDGHPFYGLHPLVVARNLNKPDVILLGLEIAGNDLDEIVKLFLLDYAIATQHTKLTQRLLSLAVELDTPEQSVLHACFHSKMWDILNLFLDLEQIGDINCIDANNNTIYNLLAYAKQWEILTRLLLRPNANINVAGQGQDILFLAAKSGNQNVMSAILRCSQIDINAKNADGQSAFDVAFEAKNIPALRVLIHNKKIDLSEYEFNQLAKDLQKINVIQSESKLSQFFKAKNSSGSLSGNNVPRRETEDSFVFV